MTHPPRITDGCVLIHWMGLEIAKMRDSYPLNVLLVVLIGGKEPVSITKKGDVYHFDASVIATQGKTLPEDMKRRLRLPVLFYGSSDRPLRVPR